MRLVREKRAKIKKWREANSQSRARNRAGQMKYLCKREEEEEEEEGVLYCPCFNPQEVSLAGL